MKQKALQGWLERTKPPPRANTRLGDNSADLVEGPRLPSGALHTFLAGFRARLRGNRREPSLLPGPSPRHPATHNWDLLVLGPELAMLRTPRPVCERLGRNSSLKGFPQ